MIEDKEIKQSNNKKQLILTVLGVLVLIIAVAGISFAVWNYVFNGTLVNTISTNDISLDLLESNTNIISIENALPMSDNEGKAQTETFDFAVTSKTVKDIDIEYNINIQKLEVDNGYTSLNDNQIKVYLTDYSETQKVAPTLISNLTNYKLYTGKHSHDATHETVQDKFKLRAWIDGAVDASSWTSLTKLQYKFKIGLTSEEKEKSAYPSVVYRYGTNNVNIGGSITGFDYTEDYTSLNKNFFLKHNISDNGEVESSEVCYIKDNNLYCLKAGDGAAYSESISILQSSFGESNCSITPFNINCLVSGLYAEANDLGKVLFSSGSSNCGVYPGGDSRCNE